MLWAYTIYMKIQNTEALATSEMRRDALAIAEAGYAAIDVGAAFAREMRIEGEELVIGETRRPLRGRRIFFVGVGKCALVAAKAVEQILGDRLMGGIALDVANQLDIELATILPLIGTHPLPSETNVAATERIRALLETCEADDLVLTLISGGGSTLLALPEATMTIDDEAALFKELSAHAATIQELDTVRKHTSRARGGGLAEAAYPAEVVSLIVSDVPGNDIEIISSGPTVRDDSTVADAQTILDRYEIAAPATTAFVETLKDEKYFERVTNVLFLTNEDGLEAMRAESARRGYVPTITTDRFSGEASAVGREVAAALCAAAPHTALLSAGETTVTLGATSGKGGRNQELALAALESIGDDELILPFASDGHDNTDHAGAIADATTRRHAAARGLAAPDYLAAHRSYDFFTTTEDALIVGYTGSNVSDFIIALKK